MDFKIQKGRTADNEFLCCLALRNVLKMSYFKSIALKLVKQTKKGETDYSRPVLD